MAASMTDGSGAASPAPHRWLRVVIAGGGVAALETVLALRALVGHRVAITVLAPESEFVYQPVSVAEAFGSGEARRFSLDDLLAEQHVNRVRDSLREVDAVNHVVTTGSDASVEYDRLVVATGAGSRNPVSGALAFGGEADVPNLRALLDELTDGIPRTVAFALPSERVWPLPLYELAIMTAVHLREHGAAGSHVVIVTPEEEPLQLFGPDAAAALHPMLAARDIELRPLSVPALVQDGTLVVAGGGRIAADRVVTLPLPEGPGLPGLPCDAAGFVPVDAHGRVKGVEDVFAAGDITTFPLKQGGLATQQADAVAETIAAGIGAAVIPQPFSPVLRGLLLTGGAPLYLRAEPQRLPRSASVAIEVKQARGHGEASSASGQALWWPPAKIAGRYLSPYLATARPSALASATLADRVAAASAPVSDSAYEDALELALLLADCDARWGDYRAAVTALEAAEALHGALPPEYEAKRRSWLAEW